MKYFRNRSVKLATILSLMAVLLIGVISLFASVILFSDYKFNERALKRSETIFSGGLLKGAMPLAIASNDMELIRSIVHDHLEFEEIFGVAIYSPDGAVIYREEKPTTSKIGILARTYDVVSPYQNLEIDQLKDENELRKKVLGKITIYFSTARLHDSVNNQLYFAISMILTSIILSFALIFSFNRYVSIRLAHVVKLIESIKEGTRFADERKPLDINELDVIDSSLRDMANTIFERDNEIKNSLNDALEAKVQAQKAEEFKDDFIRAISHDIKTPIGVVVNLLELIREENSLIKIDSPVSAKVDACYRSAKLLANITDELFNLDQFQRHELVNRPESVNIKELFINIASLYDRKFLNKGITLKLMESNQYQLPHTTEILIDESKLILLLENIIDNALKFTVNGWVCVTWALSPQALKVSVRDSGIGIPDDQIQSIFDKHRQLGDLSTSRHCGRGLGLYYVKRLVEVMEAELTVSSKVGIGSVFDLTFPCKIIDPLPSTKLDKSSLKILIIDDDEMTCFTLTKMLEKLGLESSYECIPEIGYSRLIKESPDLVFIDYHMPSTSGDEVAQKAKSILPPHTSFYVCVTAEQNSKKLTMLEGIFDTIMKKPFSTQELIKVIGYATMSKRVTTNLLAKIKDQ